MRTVVWHIDGQPDDETFESEGEAVARAWMLTPAGGERPAVREVMGLGRDRPQMHDGRWPLWLSLGALRTVSEKVVEATALVQKEHLPNSLLDNESLLAAVVWEAMEKRVRSAYDPISIAAPEGAGWVSHRMKDVGPTGAATYSRRYRVIGS